ncbi:MAG: AarF/ABC1/UbiB kinase family protein [Pseudomonadota bacterium]
MTDRPKSRPLQVPAGRLNRFARLSGMALGIAGNMGVGGIKELSRGAKPVLHDLLMTPGNLGRVANELAKMRGAAMKMGQLLSMDGGQVLPPELADVLARLREDAHFMPPKQLQSVLNEGWGQGWMRQFDNFEVRPIAAASIGQVHRAELKDGREVAIKVQYPGVARSIDSDVANVGTLIALSGLVPKGFDIKPYLEEAKVQLHQETDYMREGRYLAEFGRRLAEDPRFEVPEIVEELTTEQILTMTYVKGGPIEGLIDAPQNVRNRIATDLIDLVLQEIFSLHLIQSDPNFANYRYNAETGRIALLDFGAAREIAPALAGHYASLFRAGLSGDAASMRQAALDVGFIAVDVPEQFQSRILEMMGWVFAEICKRPDYDFADNSLTDRLSAAGEAMAKEGFIPPPVSMDVLFLQRKFAGMFLLAKRLGARVPMRALIEART